MGSPTTKFRQNARHDAKERWRPDSCSAASAFGPPMEQHDSQHNMPGVPLIGLAARLDMSAGLNAGG